VLTVAVSPGDRPFEYYGAGGALTGFDVEVMDAVSGELGLSIDWKAVDFETLLSGVEASHYDAGISGITINADRSQVIDFSRPYYINPDGSEFGIAVPKGHSDVTGAINNALATMLSDGTYRDLFEKYFPGSPLPQI
jgi:ABC-type amino acid transport substrate-binding protein